MRFFSLLCLFVFVLCAQAAHAQRQTLFVTPQTTDNQINTNLEPHYVAINRSVAPKNQLFVFFPGTGGLPQYYQLISNRAADLGFHVVNLNYPNDEAVRDLCGAPNADLDCYAKVRLEIKDGTDRTPLVSVNRANSIENRLIKVLSYLQTQFPNDNWTQFLAGNSQIQWSKIVVAGHSQGGGKAGIIARYHPVSRSIMFAAMDFNGVAGAPANWIARPETTPNATTPDRFFGFSHMRDESVNFNVLTTRIWTAYGMNNYGAVVNVDVSAPPYNNTHSLTTDLNCTNANAHGCIVVDAFTPVGTNGTAVFRPVWEYLLSGTSVPFAVNSLQFARNGQIVSRPLVGLSTKYYRLILHGTNFTESSKVFVNGIEVQTEFTSATELRAKLPAGKIGSLGRSTVQIRNSNGQTTNVLNF
jgi:dienelactone hydrolase